MREYNVIISHHDVLQSDSESLYFIMYFFICLFIYLFTKVFALLRS